MEEIFKDIPGYEGFYQAGSLGSIRSLYGNKIKSLSQKTRKDGYKEVSIYKNKKAKSFKTHQLIAMTFLGHKRCGFELVVDHINNDKNNNSVNNLQVITNRLNTSKNAKNYSTKYTGVSLHRKSKSKNKWGARIVIKGKLKHLGMYETDLEASKAYQKALKELS